MGQIVRELLETQPIGVVILNAQCSGKISYLSVSAADRVVAAQMKRHRSGFMGGLDSYRCFHCQFWHIGAHRERSPVTLASIRRKKAFTAPKSDVQDA